jgi:hypothetical protein
MLEDETQLLLYHLISKKNSGKNKAVAATETSVIITSMTVWSAISHFEHHHP